MKLTDEMIIETCKKLANGDYEGHHNDCNLAQKIIEQAKTHEGMINVIRECRGDIIQLIHSNHHMIIDCIRAGWRLREEMQGCEELERMFKVK